MLEERGEKNLFVEEEADDGRDVSLSEDSGLFHEAYEEMQVEDDPIVESIPVYMNNLPERRLQSLHVIQYVGRPKARSLKDEVLKVAIKEQSKCIEVKVPIDTSKFYDKAREEEWETEVTDHSFTGVLNDVDGNLFAGVITGDGDKKKIVLVPVDSTSQIRTSFQYIDDIDKKNQEYKQENSDATKTTNFQILQTSGKTTQGSAGEGNFNKALGSSLKHMKKYDEEEWTQLQWQGLQNDKTQQLKQVMETGADDVILKTDTTMDSYIDQLIEL